MRRSSCNTYEVARLHNGVVVNSRRRAVRKDYAIGLARYEAGRLPSAFLLADAHQVRLTNLTTGEVIAVYRKSSSGRVQRV